MMEASLRYGVGKREATRRRLFRHHSAFTIHAWISACASLLLPLSWPGAGLARGLALAVHRTFALPFAVPVPAPHLGSAALATHSTVIRVDTTGRHSGDYLGLYLADR